MSESTTPAAGADRGVRAPADLLARGLRMFAAPTGAPRTRRATDRVLIGLYDVYKPVHAARFAAS